MVDVLVADDSKAMRLQVARVIREVLPEAEIRFAENGADVLKAWRAAVPPRLTVLDIHMPVLNGVELLRQAAAGGVVVPRVVIYTASRDDALRQQCIAAGAAAVVTKSREDLHEAIRAVLETKMTPDRGRSG
jgi:CheY-like chemotaxis protein